MLHASKRNAPDASRARAAIHGGSCADTTHRRGPRPCDGAGCASRAAHEVRTGPHEGEKEMAFLERGSGAKQVRLHYEEHGTPSGFPLLLMAPGGMNSTIGNWARLAVFNPLELYANDFRMIAMDQRNSGESTGPLETED